MEVLLKKVLIVICKESISNLMTYKFDDKIIDTQNMNVDEYYSWVIPLINNILVYNP